MHAVLIILSESCWTFYVSVHWWTGLPQSSRHTSTCGVLVLSVEAVHIDCCFHSFRCYIWLCT